MIDDIDQLIKLELDKAIKKHHMIGIDQKSQWIHTLNDILVQSENRGKNEASENIRIRIKDNLQMINTYTSQQKYADALLLLNQLISFFNHNKGLR